MATERTAGALTETKKIGRPKSHPWHLPIAKWRLAANWWITSQSWEFLATTNSRASREQPVNTPMAKARMVIKYYNQGHRQASVSFILSMTFAILGFIVVAVAVIGYVRNPDQLGTTVVTGVVGAINEVVSFLFFQRADKGRELMMGLVDRLRDDREKERQFAAAIGTIGQVENSGVRDALRAAVTLQFSGASTTLSDITTLAESDTFLTRIRE